MVATVRAMTESDLDAVLATETASYVEPWTEQIFRDCLALPMYQCVVMEDEGEFLGYLITSTVVDECHVMNFAVHPDKRRQGLGRQFLTYAMDEARAAGCKTVLLEVRKNSLPAVTLYQSLGFVVVGERKDYYTAETGREDALLLTKTLNT